MTVLISSNSIGGFRHKERRDLLLDLLEYVHPHATH